MNKDPFDDLWNERQSSPDYEYEDSDADDMEEDDYNSKDDGFFA